MSFTIDPKSHVPIYQQIVEGIRASVASGLFVPGEPLPSLRALALELLVNPNTVQRAYDQLEREGLVESRRGRGVFVARRGARSARSRAVEAVEAAFRRGIEAARAADLSPEAIEGFFQEAMDRVLKAREVRR